MAAEAGPVSVGLLGADYRVIDGRYQIRAHPRRRELEPEAPGAADPAGRERQDGRVPPRPSTARTCAATTTCHRLFQGTAGKQTVITVGPSADGARSRTVDRRRPCRPEEALRLRTWMEDNRRRVDELTRGRVAYVYIPDTFAGRVRELQPLLLLAGRQGCGHPRRALQPRRLHRRLHRGLPQAHAPDGQHVARRRGHGGARGRDLRTEGDDREPDVGLGRRRAALALPARGPGSGGGVRTWGGLVGIGGYPP